MKHEIFEIKGGRFRWRITRGDDVTESPKSFPTEAAAERNLFRTLKTGKKQAPIPPAVAKAKPNA